MQNTMADHKLPNGSITDEPAEMRRLAISFYTNFYSAGNCEPDYEILKELPRLGEAQLASLESTVSFAEMSTAVQQQI